MLVSLNIPLYEALGKFFAVAMFIDFDGLSKSVIRLKYLSMMCFRT